MTIELDHFFILVKDQASQADLVIALGLIEGSSNTHPGQGTANRRIFFKNTTLEFLYVHDANEASNGPATGLRFQDRHSNQDASPIGLVMRSGQAEPETPFEGWKYCPDYFADDVCFHVGSNSDVLEEPLCICMPDNLPQRKERPPPENPEWMLTNLRVSTPVRTPSAPLQDISKCQGIVVEFNKPHCLELTFNNEIQGKRKDFISEIPLILNW